MYDKDILSIKEILLKKFKNYLKEEVFFVELDKNLLNKEQKQHDTCSPHYFTITLGKTSLTAEFLVRSGKRMRCSCMGYANPEQIRWLVDLVDNILVEANVNI
ncbi:MAG: hypothetical protein CSB21_02975 [Deltaproteobacteria bacterium]|nr:MAG: hypothetical protein CSB21_02975 [Deltaproteobacteria bacterium]